MSVELLDRRLRTLETKAAHQGAYEADNTWYAFMVAPSCPPDKRLHIRGGVANNSYGFDGVIWDSFTPDVICDFEDEEATGMSLSFANANYYLPIILCYAGYWIGYRTVSATYERPIFDNVTGTEVATAAEAEAQIDAWLNGYTAWADFRFPLHGVVLHNTGTVGFLYEIMAIDYVNRGRSYLYRDARARNSLAQ